MIKCGVCGSENEAAALFCGTCGSPLTPVEATAIADDAAKTADPTTTEPDEAVVPGKDRGARRDLGTGTETVVVPDSGARTEPESITDSATTPGGATVTCAVCGTINDATRTYCRKCASELKPAPPPPPPPPPPPARRKLSPLALALGAGAIVVAIALVAVVVMGGKPAATLGPSAQASQGSQTSPGASAPGVETAEPTTLPTATPRTFTEGKVSGQIAFARCPSDGSDCSIYIRPANLSAKASRVIGATNASALDPAISPDGKTIMYVVEPGLRLVTISTRTFSQHSTGAGDTNPAWSPDGKQIVFAGHRDRDKNGDDLEIRIDGLKASSTSQPETKNDVMDHDPVFTPDGKSIIYVEGEGDARELKQLDIATGDIKALTNDAFADEDPAVSPDGTEVVFASKRGGDGSEYDLYILNLATLEITELPKKAGDEHDPDWSPGGRYIVYSGGADGSKDLFILDLSDMTETAFTTAGGSDLEPSWR